MTTECPYCEEETEINHDDGYGYAEEGKFEQECWRCGKTFAYTTHISFSHTASKAPCLNGADHKYQPTKTYPVRYAKMECPDCGFSRQMTPAETEANIAEKGE